MKILQVTFGFPPYQIGGTVRHSYLLSTGLVQKKDVKVYVFSGGLPTDLSCIFKDDNFDNIQVRRIHSFDGISRRREIPSVEISTYKNHYIEKLFENFIKKVQPDIVHFQHTIKLSTSLVHIAQKYAKKTIVSLQDFWYFCPRIHLLRLDETVCNGPEFGLNCFYCRDKKVTVGKQRIPLSKKMYKAAPFKVPVTIKRLIKGRIEKRNILRTMKENKEILPFINRYLYVMETLKRVDYILSPSQFLKSSYVAIGGESFSKIISIPPGIEPFKIEKRKSPSRPIRFGFLGLPGRYKGSYLLINIFRKISPEEAQLVIWGRGWEGFSEGLKSSGNIILKGIYSHEIISNVFSSFDVLIVPSIWGETFSFVAHEAFSVKMPVIASDIGVFNDIIKYGKNGFLFKTKDEDSLYDCIKEIIRNPELIEEFAKNIKKPKTAEEFVDEIYHFYKRILKSNSS